MTMSKQTSGELKSRVNNCINKLSDRDTLTVAANELEGIARALENDAFAPFLNCLSSTDSSEKSPVRRQCVRLLCVLSAAHGDALTPHLSRMISNVLRRLRDPDSSVRAACVEAVTSIVTHVNSPPFAVILKPLVEALFQEQDLNAQIGASHCLAAAVDAAVEPDAAELRKILPRVLKLGKNDRFKANAGLLMFIGSIVRAGCVNSKTLLRSIVSTAVEFLSSEDWATRKAAAEVLEKTAASDRNLAVEFRSSCLATLENRKFDKVKIVRETMNRALEAWHDLPVLPADASSPNVTISNQQSPESPETSVSETPQARKMVLNMSPAFSCSSVTPNSRRTLIRNNEDVEQSSMNNSKLNTSRSFRSRVVPFSMSTSSECVMKDTFENPKEFDDLSLIRKQLKHIENQQSDLLDLLQGFIGSSQEGMSSLEKRVDGLEKVLDEMSRDFGISTQTIRRNDSGGNKCCSLPGAEFLSPKFWRKAEGQSINSRYSSSSFVMQPIHGMARNDASA